MTSILDRQKAILAEHPDEWLILVGDRLYAHTADKDAIWDHWDGAWEGWEEGMPEPMVVPPFPKRGQKPPPIRGRAIKPV